MFKLQFIDLEQLCWEDGYCPAGQTKHIIQIGIVEVDSDKLTITREKKYYVRPTLKDFHVSSYCENLTGINQSKLINEGRYFPEVLRTIVKDFSPAHKPNFSWGDDYHVIATQCTEYQCKNPWIQSGITDYGINFRMHYGIKNKMQLKDSVEYLGLTFEGNIHDALNDARALASVYIETAKRIRNF